MHWAAKPYAGWTMEIREGERAVGNVPFKFKPGRSGKNRTPSCTEMSRYRVHFRALLSPDSPSTALLGALATPSFPWPGPSLWLPPRPLG